MKKRKKQKIQPIGKMAFQPTWYTKISHTYADYKKGDIVIAKDVDEKGAKKFTLFPNIQTLEQYINTSSEKKLL